MALSGSLPQINLGVQVHGVQAVTDVTKLVNQTSTEVRAVSTLDGVQAANDVTKLVVQTATEVQRSMYT
ncbi:hypothetical protein TNCV_2852651 [Trichonephila clavipes]|uniref:Uncharacterized protein n=1 Tax=Trichonephila clavipes TaxID=2585209 RepID=A0A8X6REJ3_TRICX|nr:hypothetical protein TNCV_2852651 [Trichonephila clavipes]